MVANSSTRLYILNTAQVSGNDCWFNGLCSELCLHNAILKHHLLFHFESSMTGANYLYSVMFYSLHSFVHFITIFCVQQCTL